MRQQAASSEVFAQSIAINALESVGDVFQIDRVQVSIRWDSQQGSFLMRHLIDRKRQPELARRFQSFQRQLASVGSLLV